MVVGTGCLAAVVAAKEAVDGGETAATGFGGGADGAWALRMAPVAVGGGREAGCLTTDA